MTEPWNLMYDYSYGNEEIHGATIKVERYKDSELYKITFEQITDNDDYFGDLKPGVGANVVDKSVTTVLDDPMGNESLKKRTIILKVKCHCNPPPEKTFILE
jgi:hypothetical protein